MPILNVHQQVFALSLMSNLAQEYTGTQADLQAALETKLPGLLRQLPGSWHIVWGPVVWKHEPNDAKSGPDHVWFVARNPELVLADGRTQDTYVLAVAGTATTYNWLANNARVDKVVDFSQWLASGLVTAPKAADSIIPGAAYISYGTALGVHRLASVAPPFSAAGGCLPLGSYWASFPPSPLAKVIVTGHSLGGALSPTLALGLLESRAFHSFSPQNILTYPTAGPSPGNFTFAKLFSEKFPRTPGSGYQVWNCNIVNILDIVSQAWCTSKIISPEQNLANIPTIYGSPAVPEVNAAVLGAILLASVSHILYFPLQAQRFKGTPPSSVPANIDDFIKEARHQHVEEFVKLFELSIPQARVLTGEEQGVQRMTAEEVEKTQLVISQALTATDPPSDLQDGLPGENYGTIAALCETF